jgi:hypothetical protein
MEKEYLKKWGLKAGIFTVIGMLFYAMTPNGGTALYWLLVISAGLWVLYERNRNKKFDMARAFALGVFLMLFDWFVETYGLFLGQWQTAHSLFSVGAAVPIEIMLLCLIGGTAWAMHFPKRLSWTYIAGDTLIFATFGTLGEYLMQLNGLMIYMGGWTSAHAFIGYAITWLLMSYAWYRIIKK